MKIQILRRWRSTSVQADKSEQMVNMKQNAMNVKEKNKIKEHDRWISNNEIDETKMKNMKEWTSDWRKGERLESNTQREKRKP